MSVCAIVGSAFAELAPATLELVAEDHQTPFGPARLHRCASIAAERPAYLLFRHGLPHTLLPNQINYRANTSALAALGCDALLVTSSVGVLNAEVPLAVPLPVGDIIALENRLPDGSACTMFTEPSAKHGHLVLAEGLFSKELDRQVARFASKLGIGLGPAVTFAYVQGPRTKTPAENRAWQALGADVNSMTLAPEVILAAELEIPCSAIVLGHKVSQSDAKTDDHAAITTSLDEARAATQALVVEFLRSAAAVTSGNYLYRF